MTPERWQQIKELFQAARALSGDQRDAYLAEACAGDDDLLEEVRSLLAAGDRRDSFLTNPILSPPPDPLDTDRLSLLHGKTLGPYLIERTIGRGGMGVVYLARDERLRRPVALKILPSGLTQDLDRVRRFQQEARVISALNHPNILTIYEIGQAEGTSFIATEYVEGRTLRARHAEGLTVGEVLALAIQIAEALTAAHNAGIVHRDLKPENVMVRPDGYVKVLDFGLAKLTEKRVPDKMPGSFYSTVETQPGLIMGTFNYMSPEQARGLEVDARTDIFSLGVLIYELIAGDPPFSGETPSDVIAEILRVDPAPLTRSLPGLPVEFERIVRRALAKAPENRYASSAEMLGELKHLQQELNFQAKLQRTSKEAEAAAANPLDLRVGNSGDWANRPTFVTGQAVKRSTSRVVTFFASFRRGRRALIVGAILLLVTMAVAIPALRRSWPGGDSINSLAILPFVNESGDKSMEYLPDGITESLISNLYRLPSLRVMARSTVFAYKGREIDPRQAGGEMGVQAVLTGRVKRLGDRLIIRTELVDTRDGSMLWGGNYQRPLTDLLTVQEEISREISVALRLRLTGEEQRQLARRQTTNQETYQLYLQGRYHFLKANRESQELALEYFRRAIALDPNYALAYAGISDVYADFSSQYMAPSEAMPKAREAALRALEIDPELPEAHHAMAVVKWFWEWDFAGAEQEFRRAIDLNPNNPNVYGFYSDLIMRLGRFDEAYAVAKRGYDLDPLSPYQSEILARASFYLGRYEQSIQQSRKTLELHPQYFWVHSQIAHNLIKLGRAPEAVEEIKRSLSQQRHDATIAHAAYIYTVAGRMDEARKLLEELVEQSRRRRVSPVYLARIYAGLGETGLALKMLRLGYQERSEHMIAIKVDMMFDKLRQEPEFIQLLKDVGFTP